MKLILSILFCLIAFVGLGQEEIRDSTKHGNWMVGIQFIVPNFSGPISEERSVILSKREGALMGFKSKGSFGFNISKEKKIGRKDRFKLTPEVGFFYLDGSVDFRRIELTFTNSTQDLERRYTYDYKYYYFYNAYHLSYKPFSKIGFRIMTGPKLIFRLGKKVEGIIEENIVDYSVDPIFYEFRRSNPMNEEEVFLGPQISWNIGFSKSIKIGTANFLVEFGYEMLFLDYIFAIDLQSNPITFGIKYTVI